MNHLKAACVGLLLLCAPTLAQTLSVEGESQSALLELGSTVTADLSGPAGQPYYWLFNTNPGPTVINGVSIPVKFDANLVDIGFGAPMPASGTLSLSVPLPLVASVSGSVLHTVGAFVDPGAAAGFTITNGVMTRFIMPGGDAGPDAAGMTGRALTLDGSGGQPAWPAGTTLQWIVVDAPAGSLPLLRGATTAIPAFEADLPGRYTLEFQVDGPGGFQADRVDVDLYHIAWASLHDGKITTSAPARDGVLEGPLPATLEIDGASVSVGALGSFNAGPAPMGALVTAVDAEVTAANGAVVRERLSLVQGMSAPLTQRASPASLTRVQGIDLSFLEQPLSQLVGSLPLNDIITAIPPLPVLNTTFASATVTFTSATYDQQNASFRLIPLNGNLGVEFTLPNLQITADITGSLIFAPYSETATISADPLILTGELLLGCDANGAPVVSVQNADADLQNFSFAVTGVLSGFAQIGAIEGAIQAVLETTLATALDLLPTAINPALAQLPPLSVDLTPNGIPLRLDFPICGLGYDALGMSISADFLATPTGTTTGPALSDYLVTGTTPGAAVFGATTPVNGAAYDAAQGFTQDVLNQVLAVATTTGVLAFDPAISGGLGLDAQAMALAIPGAGFELLDPSTPVQVFGRPTSAPVVTLASGAQPLALSVGNYELNFAIEAAGESIPLLQLGVSLDIALGLSVDPLTGNLSVVPGTPTVSAIVSSALPGHDPSALLQAGLNPLVQLLIAQVTAPLSNLPLGGLIPGAAITEISVDASVPDMVVIYADLP